MLKSISKCVLTMVCGLSMSIPAMAQEASGQGSFSLQGRLTAGASNEAVADGSYNATITVYEAGTDNVVATETDQISTTDGIFSTMIGDDSSLELAADMSYEIGVSIDGGAELSPRIMLGDAPSAITAEVASNANAVGGFTVSGNGGANTLVTTDANGRINADILSNSLNVTGSGVTVSTDGGTLNLDISGGSGGGDFALPFTGSANVEAGQSALRLTSMGEGSAAALLNTGNGSALDLSANSGGSAALDIANSSGAAIQAVGNMSGGAVLELQNESADASAGLISGLNAEGDAAFEVMGNGETMINATGSSALHVTSDASSDAAVMIQNTSGDANARLVSAMDASGATAFEIMGSGSTKINAAGETGLEVTTDASADAAIMVRNMSGDATASLISAVNANGDAAFEVMGSGRTTINAAGESALHVTTDASSDAALTLQNTSGSATARLISAMDAGGEAAFEVMGNGQTMINSTVGNALQVSTSASGEAALNVVGGLSLDGPVGTATLPAGDTSIQIDNPLVTANSVIMLTVNSSSSLTNGIRLASQGNGQFTVSLLDTALGALSGGLKFNYLIINNSSSQ